MNKLKSIQAAAKLIIKNPATAKDLSIALTKDKVDTSTYGSNYLYFSDQKLEWFSRISPRILIIILPYSGVLSIALTLEKRKYSNKSIPEAKKNSIIEIINILILMFLAEFVKGSIFDKKTAAINPHNDIIIIIRLNTVLNFIISLKLFMYFIVFIFVTSFIS